MRFFLSLFLLGCAPQVFALNLEPMDYTMTPDGRGSSHTFNLTNTEDKEIAFEVEVMKRDSDKAGKEIRIPTTDFNVFPLAAKVPPGTTKAIRVTYTGPQNLTQETAYRFIVKQLPLNAPEISSGRVDLKYTMNFEAALYVGPGNSQAKIVVRSAKVKKGRLELVLANEGTAHRILSNIQITFLVGKKPVPLPKPSRQLLFKNNILANKELSISLPAPKKMGSKGDFTKGATVSFD